MERLLLTGFLVLFFCAGLYPGYLGLRFGYAWLLTIRYLARLVRSEPVPIGSIDEASTPPVEFEGTGTTCERGTIQAPLSGTDCLAYELESSTRSDGDEEAGWTRDELATAAVPFVVRDGGQRIAVDPTDADWVLGGWETERVVGRSGSPPASMRERLDRHPLEGVDGVDAFETAGKRRYRERVLRPETDVHVIATEIERREVEWGGGPRLQASGEDFFEITDGSSSTHFRNRLLGAALLLVLTVVLLLFSLVWVIGTGGLLLDRWL